MILPSKSTIEATSEERHRAGQLCDNILLNDARRRVRESAPVRVTSSALENPTSILAELQSRSADPIPLYSRFYQSFRDQYLPAEMTAVATKCRDLLPRDAARIGPINYALRLGYVEIPILAALGAWDEIGKRWHPLIASLDRHPEPVLTMQRGTVGRYFILLVPIRSLGAMLFQLRHSEQVDAAEGLLNDIDTDVLALPAGVDACVLLSAALLLIVRGIIAPAWFMHVWKYPPPDDADGEFDRTEDSDPHDEQLSDDPVTLLKDVLNRIQAEGIWTPGLTTDQGT